jgi:hypothetical protein
LPTCRPRGVGDVNMAVNDRHEESILSWERGLGQAKVRLSSSLGFGLHDHSSPLQATAGRRKRGGGQYE